MVKVRSLHLLPFAQENSRSSEWLTLRMCRDWKLVCCYPTGSCAQLDAEDIEFDIYKRARELMELSSLKMLLEQEV